VAKINAKKKALSQGIVLCTYNNSYLGGGNRRILNSRPAGAKVKRPCLKVKMKKQKV
jgi:hypothetical protein